jgi:NADPH-dependent 2,4-dienoyl-CoA reductase/sulfur reductase-like enzyme
VQTIAVVGASLAGWSAALALRGAGFVGRLVLIGEEEHRPYDRPPLSKSFLAGTLEVDALALATRQTIASVGPDWRLGRRAIGLEGRRVRLDDGTAIEADGVLIATGARPRTLPAPGPLAGLHTLRTLADAQSLRASLTPGARLLVAGGGFIGAEVAATARALGCAVELVEAGALPMLDVLGERMATVVAGMHAAHGTVVRPNSAVAEVLGAAGRVAGVRLAGGGELRADAVLVGIGVAPNTEWLAGSGVDVDDGVLVDAFGATSVPGVWAAGDVARFPSARAGGHVRIEHWTHARDHGTAVGRAMLGRREPYDPLPYVWSEQYGTMIQFAGYPAPDATVEIAEGDVAERRFVALYRQAGRPVAVLGLRSPRTFTRLRRELAATT